MNKKGEIFSPAGDRKMENILLLILYFFNIGEGRGGRQFWEN